jgi:phosphoribosyl 1,2-cyclic phosphodiesterase
VRVQESCLPQLKHKHFNGRGLTSLRLKPFSDDGFKVGDLHFQPFEVPHSPWYRTYGFVVKHRRSKIVIATDFNYWDGLLKHFVDSDFVFVECNHDLELLAVYYNPNSQFHLPNPDTGDLLCTVRQCSKTPPRAVMLGHLSEMRNRPDIALREIQSSFESRGLELDFPLLVAPRLQASEMIEVNHSSRISVAMQESG